MDPQIFNMQPNSFWFLIPLPYEVTINFYMCPVKIHQSRYTIQAVSVGSQVHNSLNKILSHQIFFKYHVPYLNIQHSALEQATIGFCSPTTLDSHQPEQSNMQQSSFQTLNLRSVHLKIPQHEDVHNKDNDATKQNHYDTKEYDRQCPSDQSWENA